MSGVTPIGPLSEYHPNRDEERDRVEQVSPEQPAQDEKSHSMVLGAEQKQDAKTTIQNFQYTGKGSFIDKVF